MVQLAKFAAIAAVYVTHALAHPGEHHNPNVVKREIAAREHWAHVAKNSLSACSNNTSARRMASRNIERRACIVKELRQKKGITSGGRELRRDATELAKWEAVDHNKTGIYNYDANTPEEEIFSGRTSSILAPTITDGPYFVWGELIRQNVVESRYSSGIPLHLEVQYFDVETCEPVPGVFVDIWNANATGVYSGISMRGNYAADGYNSTYLRGIQTTDSDGVATFDTIFPGHYSGRATHTHLLSHLNATVLPNNTLLVDTGTVVHIGQLFWNEILRNAVEETYPYSSNTQPVTTNADDQWSVQQASSSYDPFPEFLYLGETLKDGLFAWKQIGLNTSADWSDNAYYNIAAYLWQDGGYANPNSSFTNSGPSEPKNSTSSIAA